MSARRVCLWALAVWLGAELAKGEGTNLLRNSGFEDEGAPWWGVTGTALRVERANWHPRTGRWSFGIGNDEGPRDASGGIAQEVDLSGMAAAGRKCYFSAWLMMEDKHTGTPVMKLEFLGEDGRTLSEVARPTGSAMKGTWQLVRIFGVVPVEATRVRAVCLSQHMKSGTGQSFVWLDDTALTVE
jgi:hypothetical protein